ncbi:MAG: hypothetical protein JWM13_216, partial [Arthrobacter sp.]|nr:hypothetical protein [Arthrobacter sp.]
GKYLLAGLNLIPDGRHGRETFRAWLAKNADTL